MVVTVARVEVDRVNEVVDWFEVEVGRERLKVWVDGVDGVEVDELEADNGLGVIVSPTFVLF